MFFRKCASDGDHGRGARHTEPRAQSIHSAAFGENSIAQRMNRLIAEASVSLEGRKTNCDFSGGGLVEKFQ